MELNQAFIMSMPNAVYKVKTNEPCLNFSVLCATCQQSLKCNTADKTETRLK